VDQRQKYAAAATAHKVMMPGLLLSHLNWVQALAERTYRASTLVVQI